jgi:fructoselysine-6-P-deglycase FrlB-like protein
MVGLGSIESLRHEVASQLTILSELPLPRPINPRNCVMTGSGDSFIAASIATYISNYRIITCYPTSIILNPSILDFRDLYIISVSGNTTHNIVVAKLASQKDIKTTAITANPQSKLAKSCDKIIRIKYRRSGATTSGTISFLSCVLICLALVTRVKCNPKDVRRSFEMANRKVDALLDKISDKTLSILFLADGLLYPVAHYGSLKMNEVLGVRSFHYSLQEYCHAPLFGLKKNDTVVILKGTEGQNGHAAKTRNKLFENLSRLNYSVFSLNFSGSSPISCLLQSIFAVQLLALKKAEKKGLRDCFFVQNRELLDTSSACIY